MDMLLYTWKDVERKLLLNKNKWNIVISAIETYIDTVVIHINKESDKKLANGILSHIFEKNYDQTNNQINLDFPDRYMSIEWEVDENPFKKDVITPLFRSVLYQQSAYCSELLHQELPGSPVLAFHSYKGGVGRTLSLLAFAKAWSELKPVKNPKRLLIVDADLEAPGITWLTNSIVETRISFLDLLDLAQEKDSIEEVLALVTDKLSDMTFTMETEKSLVEHVVLPAYRYKEQLIDMYASPESLADSYSKKYIISELLSRLGTKVNAELVLVDLRAGLSEFSAPLLFDPRVKKYIVTSTSYQSVQGTKLLLEQLSKGLPLNDENSKIPEIFLTKVQDNEDVADTVSELVSVYEQHMTEDNLSRLDNIVTPLPFASELIHLESLDKIMKSLSGRDFYFHILEMVKSSYPFQEVKAESDSARLEIVYKINDCAKKQRSAEGGSSLGVLMTNPIYNLIKKYKNTIPCTVIMGAKGSGKTFLYWEILSKKTWGNFITSTEKNGSQISDHDCIMMLPLLASGDGSRFQDILESVIAAFNQLQLSEINKLAYADVKDKLCEFLKRDYDVLQWKELWKRVILEAFFHNAYSSLDELESQLEEKQVKAVFVIDGLEEIFQNTFSSGNEKRAIAALCRDLMEEMKTKYKNLGFMVFLRKDLAQDSLKGNFEPFFSLYRPFQLQWTSTEALRLAVWLVNQAVEGFYEEDVALEKAPGNVLDKELSKLWGVKLGKPASNEAYSSRWIVAALSDFNGQLQARDIIRFLEQATEKPGKAVYPDRYIMPAEIKRAASSCSLQKMDEIRQEFKALQPVFEKLESAPKENKILPFSSQTFGFTQAEESLMKQEGYLRVEEDKYYLPEMFRHALKFKYAKGARPKVLSFTLKNEQ